MTTRIVCGRWGEGHFLPRLCPGHFPMATIVLKLQGRHFTCTLGGHLYVRCPIHCQRSCWSGSTNPARKENLGSKIRKYEKKLHESRCILKHPDCKKGCHTYPTLLLMSYLVLSPTQSTAHPDIVSNFLHFFCIGSEGVS